MSNRPPRAGTHGAPWRWCTTDAPKGAAKLQSNISAILLQVLEVGACVQCRAEQLQDAFWQHHLLCCHPHLRCCRALNLQEVLLQNLQEDLLPNCGILFLRPNCIEGQQPGTDKAQSQKAVSLSAWRECSSCRIVHHEDTRPEHCCLPHPKK